MKHDLSIESEQDRKKIPDRRRRTEIAADGAEAADLARTEPCEIGLQGWKMSYQRRKRVRIADGCAQGEDVAAIFDDIELGHVAEINAVLKLLPLAADQETKIGAAGEQQCPRMLRSQSRGLGQG